MSTTERAYEIRELALELALRAGTCHIGSALGIADILAVAYFGVMDDDDTFILSKAHAGSALMATLALRRTIDREQLLSEYCQDGGAFGGHAERGVAGVEISGGSLGHGLAIAVGRSMADRLDGRARRTFCLMGDGETDEGSVSEAAALAGRLGWITLSGSSTPTGTRALRSTTVPPVGSASKLASLRPAGTSRRSTATITRRSPRRFGRGPRPPAPRRGPHDQGPRRGFMEGRSTRTTSLRRTIASHHGRAGEQGRG